ncbi:MAG: triose-phosphate isomerase [Phycisphaeraceae bacterium]|nr:triose-phosphate isomerase [Phycisphaeraceae bacterium]
MPTRKPFVGGNWKMNQHGAEAVALAEAVAKKFTATDKVDVAVFPAFPYLAPVGQALAKAGSGIKLGAQDFYVEPNGAFTGEVSLSMLKDVGVKVVLVGHSERRHVLGETDVLINRKVRAALDAGFEVILCVGEKLEQREAGMTDGVNMAQTLYGLAGVKPEQMARVTIAYEPVWAIGTGKNATPADAQSAHQRIRDCVKFGVFSGDAKAQAIGDAVRIQYGGSVKGSNAAELFAQPDVDGGLIGGASLKADEFTAILDAAAKKK